MSAEDVAVIGFQCMLRTKVKNKAGDETELNRAAGRRYHVKAAAEELADMYRRRGEDAFVQKVYGPAEAPPPTLRKGRRVA